MFFLCSAVNLEGAVLIGRLESDCNLPVGVRHLTQDRLTEIFEDASTILYMLPPLRQMCSGVHGEACSLAFSVTYLVHWMQVGTRSDSTRRIAL